LQRLATGIRADLLSSFVSPQAQPDQKKKETHIISGS
jgi:hypothetical protein